MRRKLAWRSAARRGSRSTGATFVSRPRRSPRSSNARCSGSSDTSTGCPSRRTRIWRRGSSYTRRPARAPALAHSPPAPYRGPLRAGAQALAELFKLPRHERDLPTLEALFRSAWGRVRTTERYRPLFFERAARPDGADDDAAADDSWSHDRERERAWGLRALAALSRYFELEDPASIEPVACEERLTCSFDDLPPITGVIDRLDGDGVITDYKSGRAPHLKYARGTNARIRGESFFQLRFYAWLLRERGVPATALRLLYLGDAHEMRAEVSDDDIDRTADEARAT